MSNSTAVIGAGAHAAGIGPFSTASGGGHRPNYLIILSYATIMGGSVRVVGAAVGRQSGAVQGVGAPGTHPRARGARRRRTLRGRVAAPRRHRVVTSLATARRPSPCRPRHRSQGTVERLLRGA